jgi:hypothetical protein
VVISSASSSTSVICSGGVGANRALYTAIQSVTGFAAGLWNVATRSHGSAVSGTRVCNSPRRARSMSLLVFD